MRYTGLITSMFCQNILRGVKESSALITGRSNSTGQKFCPVVITRHIFSFHLFCLLHGSLNGYCVRLGRLTWQYTNSCMIKGCME